MQMHFTLYTNPKLKLSPSILSCTVIVVMMYDVFMVMIPRVIYTVISISKGNVDYGSCMKTR